MIRSASSVMGTSALTIKNLAGYDHLISKATTIQCVRWKRKPIWLPTAKSKLFRVPERPVISDEENKELQRLNNFYRTMTKSLRSFFVNKHIEMRNKSRVITSQEHIDEDFTFRFHVNEKWNEEVAAAREERLKNLRENRTEEILKKMEMKAERDLQIQLRVDATIRKAKEESATFITKDNIDQAIEKAFENIIDYNSAIDLDGNTYVIDNKETAENTEKLENTV